MAPTHSALSTEKRIIRTKMLFKRRSLSSEEVLRRSQSIEDRLISMPEFQKSDRIMFYVSLPGEVDTHGIIQDCLKDGKKVVVPITNLHENTLFLSEINTFPVGLHKSTYGVLEPELADSCHLETRDIDLIIVPGVAFDRCGHRLGHGGGYYDRFLKKMEPDIPKIALAFDFQILENIPREIWDVPVDRVVTESEIIQCKNFFVK